MYMAASGDVADRNSLSDDDSVLDLNSLTLSHSMGSSSGAHQSTVQLRSVLHLKDDTRVHFQDVASAKSCYIEGLASQNPS